MCYFGELNCMLHMGFVPMMILYLMCLGEQMVFRPDLLLGSVVDGVSTRPKVVSLSSFSLIEFCIEMTNLGLSYV